MLKKMLGALGFGVVTLAANLAQAQPFPGEAKDPFPACATSIATGGGSTFAIGCTGSAEGTIWKRSSTGWFQFSTDTFKQVTVSGAGIPWAIKANGTIWKGSATSSAFQQKGQPGACLAEIAAGATDTDVWGLGCSSGTDQSVWRFDGSVFNMPQAGALAAHIAIGSNSHDPWAVHSSGLVFHWNGATFGFSLPGCATAVGGNGWAIGCGDRRSIWQYVSNVPTLRGSNPLAIKGISSDGLTALEDAGGVLLQSNITSFGTGSLQIGSSFTLEVQGSGFTPNKHLRFFYQHPTAGWLEVSAFVGATGADGSINVIGNGSQATPCSFMQLHRDPATYRNMQLRMDSADGTTTYFTSTSIYDFCQPFIQP